MTAAEALRRAIDAALAGPPPAQMHADGARVDLDRAELEQLRELLAPGAELSGGDAPVLLRFEVGDATVYVHLDASVRPGGATVRARLREPEALAAFVLARIDLPAVERCGRDAAERRGQWLRAAPPEWRQSLEDIAWCGATPSLPGGADIPALLAWHGAMAGPWSKLPPCMRALHGITEAMTVAQILKAATPSEAVWRGAARLIAERVRSRSQAEDIRRALDRGALEAIAALAEREAEGSARARVALVLSGEPPAAPPGTELLAVARHGRFDRLYASGGDAVAYDGWTLRWFGDHAGETRAMRKTAVAIARGRVLVERGVILCIDPASGTETTAKPRSRVGRWLASHRSSKDAWEREKTALCRRHLGRGPSEDAIFAEPSENDFDACVAFGPLGVPPPPALGLSHLFLGSSVDAVVHALPRRSGALRRSWSFDEPVVALAADHDRVHAIADGKWWALRADGTRELERELDVYALRGIHAVDGALLATAEDPLGDFVLRVPPIDAEPRSR